MELNILARTLAERLTRKIVHAAFELAETRWDLEISEETNGMGNRVEMADDIVKCLNGEEIGCLDPDDPEDAAKISNFVNECEAVIREAIDKTRQQTLEDLASDLNGSRRTVEVMPAVDKRYSDGLWEGLTIAIEWVDKHARRSLKQSNSETTQPAKERG